MGWFDILTNVGSYYNQEQTLGGYQGNFKIDNHVFQN
jgi:hypothetical protein